MSTLRTYKRAIIATGLVLSAVSLAACGGGGGGSPSSPPPPPTFTVGGTVSGLGSASVVLQVNGSNDLTVTANGAFIFSSTLASGNQYSVTVRTQPSTPAIAQNCTVSGGTGTVSNANVTNVSVECMTTAINGISVPPPPGSANDSTIAGIDSDNNGIRDDIDIFIATKYGANATATKAARVAARALQRVLVSDSSSKAAATVALQDSGGAGECAGKDFDSAGMDSSRELNELFFRTNNTLNRLDQRGAVIGRAGVFMQSIGITVCQ